MQINVVSGGTPQLFNAMLFPEASQETRHWLREQFQRDMSHLTDVGRQLANSATQLFQKTYDSDFMRKARSMMRSLGGMFHPNAIVPASSIEELQTAKPVMQRYIMAMPEIRRIYHRQLCDGYSDSYVDHQPGAVGEDHYDYRRVMSTMVVEDEDGGWHSRMYPDELVEGDRELEADERFAILRTWDLVKLAMGERIDPTDIFNRDLEV